jgi:adenosine 3'-phospho 5'-phosphosulfate transporter B2
MESVDLEKGNPVPGKDEDVGLISEQRTDKQAPPKDSEGDGTGSWKLLAGCAIGLQLSYLTWGVVQERVMTTTYSSGEKFPSATFCVFSNRVMAIMVAACLMVYDQGSFKLAAPIYAFAPPSISNTLSSYGQYEALHYVSFPLQTLSKSTKVIPVMLMGKFLNGKTYPWAEYGQAALISFGVSVFAMSGGKSSETETALRGVAMLALYIASDSFTSQYQSRVYKASKDVTQFQMMFATNTWSILFTLAAMLSTGEFFGTIGFLQRNPEAVWDNIAISVTSATGQVFIFYTIKKFGPVVFTLIMTTRQMFSMVLSTIFFGHTMGAGAGVGALIVFATLFYRVKQNSERNAAKKQETDEPVVVSQQASTLIKRGIENGGSNPSQ